MSIIIIYSMLLLSFTITACAKPNEVLLKSSLENDIVVCKKSIKRWADVNLRIKTRGYKGFTLLMWVSRKGNLKLVKLFIKAGANIKLKTPQNKIKYAYTI